MLFLSATMFISMALLAKSILYWAESKAIGIPMTDITVSAFVLVPVLTGAVTARIAIDRSYGVLVGLSIAAMLAHLILAVVFATLLGMSISDLRRTSRPLRR